VLRFGIRQEMVRFKNFDSEFKQFPRILGAPQPTWLLPSSSSVFGCRSGSEAGLDSCAVTIGTSNVGTETKAVDRLHQLIQLPLPGEDGLGPDRNRDSYIGR
jgi:hypothetical protein